jgi:hypothetical protein
MILGHLSYHMVVTYCGVRTGLFLCGMRGYDPSHVISAFQAGEDYDGFSNVFLNVFDHSDVE